jgi:nitroimidazol reductase NimA-like FMN-containing flavoprotein (pyridoxamine 5'-phosphate oxidase superfamily)
MQTMTLPQVVRLLSQSRIGRLCMADGAGKPYAIPLPFTWMAGALYLRIPMTGRKGEVLAANNQVCFEVDHYTDTLDDYASVLVEGRLSPVADVAEKAQVRRCTRRKYQRLRRGHRPGHGRQIRLEDLSMCKIVVERISGRRKSRPQDSFARGATCKLTRSRETTVCAAT